MAKISPFAGIRYNRDKVDIAKVLSPPYDVISSSQRDEFEAQSEFNIVKLILNKERESDTTTFQKHERANAILQQWLNEKILVQENIPSIYLYIQNFTVDGNAVQRMGFLARLRIEPEGEKVVYPHENTLAKPKEDRLMLVKTVKGNLSPIFGFYNPADRKTEDTLLKYITENAPCFDVTLGPDNIRNRLWVIPQGEVTDMLEKELSDKDVFIADGHHRYEVGTLFSKFAREKTSADFPQDFDHILCYLTPLREESVPILPIYRAVTGISDVDAMIKRLESLFIIESVPSMAECESLLAEHKDTPYAYGIYFGDERCYFLKPGNIDSIIKIMDERGVPEVLKVLDVAALHHVVFEHLLRPSLGDALQISYIKEKSQAKGLIDSKKQQALFLLNGTKAEQVKGVAKAGEKMPPKSTFFYPKVLTGLVINRFDSLKGIDLI